MDQAVDDKMDKWTLDWYTSFLYEVYQKGDSNE